MSPKRIEALNDAGLDYLQISMTTSSQTSIEEESPAARQEAPVAGEHADFDVNINSVVGGGIRTPTTPGRSTGARANWDSRRQWGSSTTAPAS